VEASSSRLSWWRSVYEGSLHPENLNAQEALSVFRGCSGDRLPNILRAYGASSTIHLLGLIPNFAVEASGAVAFLIFVLGGKVDE
jgi:hypothetical protein